MLFSVLTEKGQTTIPKKVRDLLKLEPGDRIEYVVTRSGEVSVKAVRRRLSELRGMLAPARRKLTIEQMNEIVGQAAVERAKRSR